MLLSLMDDEVSPLPTHLDTYGAKMAQLNVSSNHFIVLLNYPNFEKYFSSWRFIALEFWNENEQGNHWRIYCNSVKTI